MDGTFLTEEIESPVFGHAETKKESTNAPTFRATLYPPHSSSCFSLSRLRLASIGQAAIGPGAQSFTENVECRRSRDSSTGARERERAKKTRGMSSLWRQAVNRLYHSSTTTEGCKVSPSMSTNLSIVERK